ncbi:MAG: ATP-binding cassette domain-containing protein [Gammaproteobacteria bacterium]
MQVVVCAQDVSLGYQHSPVIQGFNAEITAGQIIGILGPNGAGKTTLLRSLLGLLPPIAGQLSVLGQAPPNCGNVEIGYVPQSLPQLHAAISGHSLLAATIRGNRWGWPRLTPTEKFELDRVIELVGAGAYIARPFMQLSGGEQRRILLAQALLNHPTLLLLDEPLANLDPTYQHQFIQLLENLRQHTTLTLLLTSHDLNPLVNMLTQVLYLAQGNAVIGAVEDIITSEVLSAVYGSAIEVIQYNGRFFITHSVTGQSENVCC